MRYRLLGSSGLRLSVRTGHDDLWRAQVLGIDEHTARLILDRFAEFAVDHVPVWVRLAGHLSEVAKISMPFADISYWARRRWS